MIPVCEPSLIGNELKYVNDCLKTNWISSSGKYIELFEQAFSKFCNVKYGVACSSGTAAVHLALETLGIGPGDEVIIPDFTMIATSNAIIYTGAKPVLVDSEKGTWGIDVNKIEEKITKKTKAILPVHIYGHPVDMDPLLEIAKKHNLYVVEDAAEAHGAEYKGRRIGSLSDIACFSFYANKIITTGEGGMIVTNNKKLAERARLLKNLAFIEPRFLHEEIGFNYRLTNTQAAIGLAQTENADKLVEMRRRNAKLYNKYLSKIPGIVLPPEEPWAKNVYWMYGVLVEPEEFGMKMPELRKALQEKGIGTRTFFIPMHEQPLFKKNDPRLPDVSGNYPVADELGKKGLYLPSSSTLKEEQIKYIAETIKEIRESKNLQ